MVRGMDNPQMAFCRVGIHHDGFQIFSRHYHRKWHCRSRRECSSYQVTVTITRFFFLALSINTVSLFIPIPCHPPYNPQT